jgi:hypothetical protein
MVVKKGFSPEQILGKLREREVGRNQMAILTLRYPRRNSEVIT